MNSPVETEAEQQKGRIFRLWLNTESGASVTVSRDRSRGTPTLMQDALRNAQRRSLPSKQAREPRRARRARWLESRATLNAELWRDSWREFIRGSARTKDTRAWLAAIAKLHPSAFVPDPEKSDDENARARRQWRNARKRMRRSGR